jgi:hypothetical protein
MATKTICRVKGWRFAQPISGGGQEGFDFSDARRWVFGKVVLPDSQDMPTLLTQGFCNQTVATFVCREFFLPKRPVVDGRVGMLRAAMPKTSVHEDDDAVLAEREVGFSEKRLMSSPAGDAVGAKKRGKHKLGFLVSTSANARHHFRPFDLGENVRHPRICRTRRLRPAVVQFPRGCERTSGRKGLPIAPYRHTIRCP